MNIEKYFKGCIQRHLGVVLLWSQYQTMLPLFELSWNFLSLPLANFLFVGCSLPHGKARPSAGSVPSQLQSVMVRLLKKWGQDVWER